MRVKMLSIASGPSFSAQPGEIHDVGPEFATALVAGNHAVLLEPPVKPAKAAKTAKAPDAPADDAPADDAPADEAAAGEAPAVGDGAPEADA